MKNKLGFTLIEVLIALVILSVALTAVIKAVSQNLRDTAYLEQKNIADWVGTNIINEVQLGLRTLSSGEVTAKAEMLDQEWIWTARVSTTPNTHIKKIEVKVYKNHSKAPLVILESYYYEA